jgi:hypothetical protein
MYVCMYVVADCFVYLCIMSIISFRRYLKKIRGGDKQKRDDCSQFKIIFSPNLNCRNLLTIISAWRGFRGKQRDTREKKNRNVKLKKKNFRRKNVSVDLYTCGLTMIRRNSSKRFISSIAFWMPTKYVCTSFSLEKPKKWKV